MVVNQIDHHRAEQLADVTGSSPLDREQHHRMPQVSGTTSRQSRGLAFASPSTALRTEMAGVITPSPYSSAAPMTARSSHAVTLPLRAASYGTDRARSPAGRRFPLRRCGRTHDECQILDRDHHEQRPEHQREDAEQVGGQRASRARPRRAGIPSTYKAGWSRCRRRRRRAREGQSRQARAMA